MCVSYELTRAKYIEGVYKSQRTSIHEGTFIMHAISQSGDI